MVNYTAHPVNIINPEFVVFINDIRKYVLTVPLAKAILFQIPPSGTVLSAQFELVKSWLGEQIDGIPIISKTLVSVTQPPVGEDCLVSQMYAAAYRQNNYQVARLFCIGETVYANTDGTQPVGTLNLQRV